MFEIEITSTLDKKLSKIKKKNRKEFDNIKNKILEIANSNEETINHYKNLKKPKQYLKRVHLNTKFVLLFEYKKETKVIKFIDYKHHDEAYI